MDESLINLCAIIYMISSKVPYLQYEILEYLYLKPNVVLGEYLGYPEDSLIVKNAKNKLIEKRLLTPDFKLTKNSKNLVAKHVKIRYKFPNYEGLYLNQNYVTRAIPPILLNNNHNKNGKIFRWYKYLEDFPGDFIKETIQKYKINKKYFILDPFVGSGTTSVQAKLNGFKNIGIDVNPVMVSISNNKLNWTINTRLLKKHLSNLILKFKLASDNDKKESIQKTNLCNMPKREINQWLSPVKQAEVSYMLYLINSFIKESDIRNLLLFIISVSALNSSYVAFCPGTTFYPFREKQNFLNEFIKLSEWIIEDLKNPKIVKNRNISSKVILGSFKDIDLIKNLKGKIDLIITSPPYPNDLEYTRQTRLELYLLGYAKNMNDIKSLKKRMIKGSTKLIFKEDKIIEEIKKIEDISRITKKLSYRLKDKNWGFDYPKMIEQYFSDMWQCLENCYYIMIKGGTCVFVVGNQTFKGVVIPVPKILEKMSKYIGFRKFKIELHRNRRSTTHIIPIPEKNLIITK